MLIAITREVSRSIIHCELTHLARTPIDVSRARAQHTQYVSALQSLGVEVTCLPEEPDLPDSVFVEDTAIVLDEAAVLTNPGADSRKPEVESMAAALAPYRQLIRVQPPAMLDGGDVLTVGKDIYVGLSTRSNIESVKQLREFLGVFGYRLQAVTVTGCLHLKSAVTQVSEKTLLINPAWAGKSHFEGFDFIEVDPSEPYAANALLIDDAVIYPSEYPKTRERLEAAGIPIVPVEAGELAKAEGGVTCCSLVFRK
jgi:dimethylargininase